MKIRFIFKISNVNLFLVEDLRVGRSNAKFMKIKKPLTFNRMSTVLVPTTRFELARPCEHHPLKVACLPISPRGLKNLVKRLLSNCK